VQQSQDGPFGWQRSNCTGQRPLQFDELQAPMTGKQEQVLPFGAFTRQVCPGGQLPPHTPAEPFGSS